MFEPRGHDVMSGSILYPPTREDCELGVLYIEVQRLPADVRPRHHRHRHGRDRGGAGAAAHAGPLRARGARRPVVVEYVQEGAFVEQVRLHNVPAYLHAADVPIDVPGLGDAASTSPTAATSTPSSSRSQAGRPGQVQRRRPDPLEPGGAPGRSGSRGAGAPRGRPHPRRHPHPVVRRAAQRARARAQRRVLRRPRRSTARPAAPAHPHAWRSWSARGRWRSVRSSSTRASSAACSIAGWKRRRMSATTTRSVPSVAGWARITGHNTIFVDDRDPFAHGFQVV